MVSVTTCLGACDEGGLTRGCASGLGVLLKAPLGAWVAPRTVCAVLHEPPWRTLGAAPERSKVGVMAQSLRGEELGRPPRVPHGSPRRLRGPLWRLRIVVRCAWGVETVCGLDAGCGPAAVCGVAPLRAVSARAPRATGPHALSHNLLRPHGFNTILVHHPLQVHSAASTPLCFTAPTTLPSAASTANHSLLRPDCPKRLERLCGSLRVAPELMLSVAARAFVSCGPAERRHTSYLWANTLRVAPKGRVWPLLCHRSGPASAFLAPLERVGVT